MVKKQERLARLGLAGEIDRYEPEIEISIVVPVNQPNSKFGFRNKNLTGKMVKIPSLTQINCILNLRPPKTLSMQKLSVAMEWEKFVRVVFL